MDRFPLAEGGNQPSLGGDVADFLGTLRDGKSYQGSMNPQGNPFRDRTVGEMVDYFSAAHGPENLEDLRERLDDFAKANTEGKEEPKIYDQARKAIEQKLENLRPNASR